MRKEISAKYINPPHTLEFAILFVPTESLYAEILRQPGLSEQLQRDYRVMIAGPTNLAALLTSFQMGFRSLALQKRSSEVWQLLGAIKGEFDKYGDVVSSLARQLNAASNSVDNLGKRTRVMSRKLKDVEVLSDQQAAESFLGFSGDDPVDGGFGRDMFPAMLRISEKLRPRAILIENVRGILAERFTDFRGRLDAALARQGFEHCCWWMELNLV